MKPRAIDLNGPTVAPDLIITDGGENSSRKRAWPEVRELLQGLDSTDCETIWFGTSALRTGTGTETP